MRLWPRRTPAKRDVPALVGLLRGTSSRLTGWKLRGSSSVDVSGLLDDAADMIAELDQENSILTQAGGLTGGDLDRIWGHLVLMRQALTEPPPPGEKSHHGNGNGGGWAGPDPQVLAELDHLVEKIEKAIQEV